MVPPVPGKSNRIELKPFDDMLCVVCGVWIVYFTYENNTISNVRNLSQFWFAIYYCKCILGKWSQKKEKTNKQTRPIKWKYK